MVGWPGFFAMLHDKQPPKAREEAVAQKLEVLLTDDLDGGEAHETVTFGLDGVTYEIDLSKTNAGKMRKALGLFVEHARTAPRTKITGSGRATRRRAAVSAKANLNDIRTWARENGFDVKDRGRVPADITAKYEAAHT